MSAADPVVSATWLKDRLNAPDIRTVDCSWYMPGVERDPEAEFLARHIPGSVRFDIDRIADQNDPLPHMLPDPMAFARAVGALGLGSEHRIVCYAVDGLHAAARVWWMFRVMGHDAVSVLDGGLPKWIAARGPLQSGPPMREAARFTPRFRKELVRSYDQVAEILKARAVQVVDVRAADRFRGEAAEPRAGVRKGHMLGALNAPFTELVAPDGTLRPKAALEAALKKHKVNLDKPVVTSCGSGITATVTALAMARLGHWDTAVYDGSWTEWGGREDSPVVTGPA